MRSQPATITSSAPPLAKSQPTAQNQKTYLADAKSSSKTIPKPAPLRIHQVKSGETITAIASKYKVSSNDLVELNRIANSNVIFVNQRLTIPERPKILDKSLDENLGLDTQTFDLASVESSETERDLAPQILSSKMPTKLLQPLPEDPYIAKLKIEIEQRRAKYRQEQAAKLSENDPSLVSVAEPLPEVDLPTPSPAVTPQNQSETPVVRGNLKSNLKDSLALTLPPLPSPEEYLPSAFDGYIWPAKGVFTSGYGWRWGRLHRGIDIAAPVGTPIIAAAAGKVIGSGWHGGYGNLVKIKHLDGSVTYYAHNHRNLVTHGQQVKQGEQIAEMGSTGRSTGSHLHFEIHLRDNVVADPLVLLSKR